MQQYGITRSILLLLALICLFYTTRLWIYKALNEVPVNSFAPSFLTPVSNKMDIVGAGQKHKKHPHRYVDSNFTMPSAVRKKHVRIAQNDEKSSHLIERKFVGLVQNDEKLIKEIKQNWLIPPSSAGSLNLKDPNKLHYSQKDQSQVVDELLNGRRNGFFIECGAGNGETLSNSLFFEKSRNWTGLLVEANPTFFESAKLTNRKSFLINACLSPYTQSVRLKFTFAKLIGGITNQMEDGHQKRIQAEGKKTGEEYVTCFPLYSVLAALDVSHVDYFSLDVEGAEIDILKTIPWDKITIDVLTIEYEVSNCRNCTLDKLAQIRNFMKKAGPYEEYRRTLGGLDVVFHRVN